VLKGLIDSGNKFGSFQPVLYVLQIGVFRLILYKLREDSP
jgi:hypothetical protein